MIKFVSCLPQIGGGKRFPLAIKLTVIKLPIWFSFRAKTNYEWNEVFINFYLKKISCSNIYISRKEFVKLKKLETKLLEKKPDKDVTENRDAILKEISSDDDNAGSNSEPVEVVDNKAAVSGTVGPQETVNVSEEIQKPEILKPPVVFAKHVTPKESVPANDQKNDNVHADKIEVPAGPKNEVPNMPNGPVATAKKRKRPPLMDLIRENYV